MKFFFSLIAALLAQAAVASTSSFSPSDSAIVIGGYLQPAASNGLQISRRFMGWNCQIEFSAVGTECVILAYNGTGTPVDVIIDGGMPTTLTPNNIYGTYTLFTGLSDASHHVLIRLTAVNTSDFYIVDTAGILITGSSPSIAVPNGEAPSLQTQNSTFQSNSQFEGGWTNFSSFGLVGISTLNSVSVVRLRTRRSDIKVYIYCQGQTLVVATDGAQPLIANIVTAPSTDDFQWVTLVSGLDTTTDHDYEIINTNRTGPWYIQNIMLGSGTTNGQVTHTYTERDILIAFGTSITEGFNDSTGPGSGQDNHDFDGYAWRTARALNLALCNVGKNSTTMAADKDAEVARIVVSSDAAVKWVTDEFGTNDAVISSDQTTFRTTAEALYSAMASTYTNATIISLGILPSQRNSMDAATYSALKATAVANIANSRVLYRDTGTNGGTPWIDTTIGSDLVDTVHPSVQGHTKIAVQLALIFSPSAESLKLGGFLF